MYRTNIGMDEFKIAEKSLQVLLMHLKVRLSRPILK